MEGSENSDRASVCVDDVLITAELSRRPSRAPDYAAESRALSELAQEMTSHPEGVLRKLSELAMELCHADSAGVSVLEPGGEHGVFRWHAAVGAFASNLNGTVRREVSPCGTVIDRNELLLLYAPERFFPAVEGIEPRVYENLVAPWVVNGVAVGTLWLINHTPDGHFDAEDARLLTSLSRFASAAYQMVTALNAAQAGNEELERKVNERTKALRESEARARSLLMNLPGGAAFVVDHDLRYQLAGGEALEQAGFTSRSFVGFHLDKVLPPELVQEYTPLYRQVLAGQPFSREHEAHEHVYLTRGVPLRNDQGEVYGALAVSYDITERRRAESALRASEERHALLLRLSDALRTIEDEVEIQNTAMRLLGEQLGLSVNELETLLPQELASYRSLDIHDTRPPIWTDEETGLIREVAERTWTALEHVRAEAALRRSEEKYRTLFETMGQGYCELELLRDADGRAIDQRYLELNPAFERHFGITALEARGRTAREVFPELEPRWHDAFARIVKRGVPERIEYEFASFGRWYEVFAYPRGGDRLVVLYEDITDRKRAEAALRASESRLRALVTAGSHPIYRMSPDWRQMFQLDGSNLLADTAKPVEDWLTSYILPEDQSWVMSAVNEAVRSRSLFELEHRVRTAEGGVAWVLSRAVPIFGVGGEIVEWFGAGIDVTARHEAEDALRASGEKHRAELEQQVRQRTAELQASRDLLQATMDGSMDMIQVFKAVRDEQGEIVDFRWVLNNHTSESRFGEVRGESLLERNPGVVEEGIFEAFKLVVQTGEPVVAERHYVHEQFNGWFFQSAVKVDDGVATTTKDITAWKEAQAEVLRLQDEVAQAKLRESEQNLHGIANVVPDLLWYGDPDGSTPWYNRRWLEYTGQSFEQAIGWGWVDAIHPDDREGSARRYREAVEQSQTLQQEHRIRRHDGTYRWFLVRAEPLLDERGRVTRMYGAATDIHEQRLALEALRESEERQAFLLRLSDVLRPLADAVAIQGQATQLLGQHLGVSRAVYAEFLVEGGRDVVVIEREHRAPGATSFVGRYPAEQFGPDVPDLRAGRMIVVADTEQEAATEELKSTWRTLGVRARLGVPLVKDGRLVAGLGVQSSMPRAWTDIDIALVEETAERTWAAVERARAEAALRASEEQFRRALEDAPIPVIMQAEDGQVLQISRTWTELTGYGPEDIPTFDAWLNHAYGEGADAVRGHMHELFQEIKRSVDIEFSIRTRTGEERYWSFTASSPGTLRDGRRFIVGMAVDITEPKRREANQRLLVDISEDLSRLSDEEEIIRAVGSKLAAHLDLACYHYVEVDEERAEVTVRHFWHALNVPAILGTYPISGFVTPRGLLAMRAGDSTIINDTQGEVPGDTPASAALKAGAAAQKIGAFVAVPYSQDGKWKAYFAVADSCRRCWTSLDVEVIQEVSNRVLPRLERARAERALRESEERFRLLVDNVQEYALLQTDLEGRVTSWNPGAERLFGYASAEILRQYASTLLTSDDQQADILQREMERVLKGAREQDARWLVRKDGTRFWAQWVTEPVRDATGQLRGVAKVLRDETERKRAEERQLLLMGELNHRVKNTLASVQSIASQTLRSTSNPDEFVTRFQGRLQALSRAHNLLTRMSWEAADVAEILHEQLTLNGDAECVSIEGPRALLGASSSLALALVIHELGTNARKYGALSVPGGRLTINWSIESDEDGPLLQLEWREHGGPVVRRPEKPGFGTTLIAHSLAGVGGKTELEFQAEGLRCRIQLPLASGTDSREEAFPS